MIGRPVIVIGAGGHAKVVLNLLLSLGRTVLAAVETVAPERQRQVLGVPVKEGDEFLLSHDAARVELALGVGMPTERPIEGLTARRAEAARLQGRGRHVDTVDINGPAIRLPKPIRCAKWQPIDPSSS